VEVKLGHYPDHRRVRPVAEGMVQRSVRLIAAEAAKQLVRRRVTRADHCVRQAAPKGLGSLEAITDGSSRKPEIAERFRTPVNAVTIRTNPKSWTESPG
jgi:hypothetical protein